MTTPNKTEKDLWVEMSIREIWTQAHFAEIAYSHVDPKSASGNDAVFSSIHSFLSHCAMISKMIKATDDSTPPKPISDILQISDSSVIHQRIFRNHLEHYDERLKDWIKQSGANCNIGTYNIGPKGDLQISNIVFVRHYDSNTKTFTFVNDDFDLSVLANEVQRIKILADTWVKNMESGKTTTPFI